MQTVASVPSIKVLVIRGKNKNVNNRYMFNLDKFISDSVTFRPSSMFESDIKANSEKLEGIFAKEDFTKAQVVEALKEFFLTSSLVFN